MPGALEVCSYEIQKRLLAKAIGVVFAQPLLDVLDRRRLPPPVWLMRQAGRYCAISMMPRRVLVRVGAKTA